MVAVKYDDMPATARANTLVAIQPAVRTQWLHRFHRLVPRSPELTTVLAATRLAAGQLPSTSKSVPFGGIIRLDDLAFDGKRTLVRFDFKSRIFDVQFLERLACVLFHEECCPLADLGGFGCF